jgi:hypothetical protein
MARWEPGSVVIRREIWKGWPYCGIPTFVIDDGPDQLALYLPEKAAMGFPEGPWPGGEHPWSGRHVWSGHGVVMLHRPQDAYAVWVFWSGPDRVFSHWYINLQAPYRRTNATIDTLDHELDLWSEDGQHWHRKDDELLTQRVAEGKFTSAEAAEIRLAAADFLAQAAQDGPWWDLHWSEWIPPRGWIAPGLPMHWDLDPGRRR